MHYDNLVYMSYMRNLKVYDTESIFRVYINIASFRKGLFRADSDTLKICSFLSQYKSKFFYYSTFLKLNSLFNNIDLLCFKKSICDSDTTNFFYNILKTTFILSIDFFLYDSQFSRYIYQQPSKFFKTYFSSSMDFIINLILMFINKNHISLQRHVYNFLS